MRKILAFAAGAMCGAIVGAVAALLLAPMSGGEIQEQARKRFEAIVTEGRKAAEERRAELEKQLRQMQRRDEG
ncbi:MAG TPA: YtxH domain-containing protein [Anaerolineae bacterium]